MTTGRSRSKGIAFDHIPITTEEALLLYPRDEFPLSAGEVVQFQDIDTFIAEVDAAMPRYLHDTSEVHDKWLGRPNFRATIKEAGAYSALSTVRVKLLENPIAVFRNSDRKSIHGDGKTSSKSRLLDDVIVPIADLVIGLNVKIQASNLSGPTGFVETNLIYAPSPVGASKPRKDGKTMLAVRLDNYGLRRFLHDPELIPSEDIDPTYFDQTRVDSARRAMRLTRHGLRHPYPGTIRN